MNKMILHLLMHTGRVLQRAIDDELSQHNLHHGQARALVQIGRAKEISQADLARRMDLKPATITNMLKPLEKRQLITRKTDPKTNRAQLVSATESGLQFSTKIEAIWNHTESLLTKNIDPSQQPQLLENLESILQSLGGTLPKPNTER